MGCLWRSGSSGYGVNSASRIYPEGLFFSCLLTCCVYRKYDLVSSIAHVSSTLRDLRFWVSIVHHPRDVALLYCVIDSTTARLVAVRPSFHSNPSRCTMFRIQHSRRRCDDFQRTQHCSSSIDCFAPRITVVSCRNNQWSWLGLFGPIFGFPLRRSTRFARLVGARGYNWLHSRDGLLVTISLLARLSLLLIDHRGADSN
jgi:hypothetical protein